MKMHAKLCHSISFSVTSCDCSEIQSARSKTKMESSQYSCQSVKTAELFLLKWIIIRSSSGSNFSLSFQQDYLQFFLSNAASFSSLLFFFLKNKRKRQSRISAHPSTLPTSQTERQICGSQ
ncbi:hypothetical protein FQA47_020310 [Oryzias melastigma]|uniref:Uncharacterized protein n=1 Tax=Oryzias melastigma TaxID=30732 RepID=A0A834FKZ3_ORYME|nr:hypothetical protein FQA47_020310 [Oryzias melastigma]